MKKTNDLIPFLKEYFTLRFFGKSYFEYDSKT